MDYAKAVARYGIAACLSGALAVAGVSPGAAGRRDAPPAGSAQGGETVRCPPRIIAKCAKGEKPVCVRLKGACCATFRCRKPG
jgi:hypothetical protein